MVSLAHKSTAAVLLGVSVLIVAKAHGGTDHISNLQLLCGHCNSVKDTKTQEELLLALTDKVYIKRKHAA